MTQREVMERILKAWQHFPQLRLGQFLHNIITPPGDGFYRTNEQLVEAAEQYVKDFKKG
jgi:uncharacterized protein YihD (DUF1040 family)